jgi:hypothetical protein
MESFCTRCGQNRPIVVLLRSEFAVGATASMKADDHPRDHRICGDCIGDVLGTLKSRSYAPSWDVEMRNAAEDLRSAARDARHFLDGARELHRWTEGAKERIRDFTEALSVAQVQIAVESGKVAAMREKKIRPAPKGQRESAWQRAKRLAGD